MSFPSLPLLENEIHLWYCFPETIRDPELLAEYRHLLSPGERQRLERFHFARHRHEFLVSHALVRTVLSRYAEAPPREWQFETGTHGKPEIAAPQGGPPLRFNLSHTQGLVACGVTLNRDLGVDVENIEREVSVDLARRFFAPSEVAHLEGLPVAQQQGTFFQFWTLKESYIKARGLGLAIPLEDFAFQLVPGQPPGIAFAPSLVDEPADWQFFQPACPSHRHQAAVAVRCPVGQELKLIVRQTAPLRH